MTLFFCWANAKNHNLTQYQYVGRYVIHKTNDFIIMVLSATNYVDVAEKISFFFLNILVEVFRRNHVPKLKEKEETRLKMKKSKKTRPAKHFRSENDLTMSFYTIQICNHYTCYFILTVCFPKLQLVTSTEKVYQVCIK